MTEPQARLDTGEFDAKFERRVNRGMWAIFLVGLGMVGGCVMLIYYVSRLPTVADNEKQIAAYAPSRQAFAQTKIDLAKLEGRIEALSERYSRFETQISASLKEIKEDLKDIVQQLRDPTPRRRFRRKGKYE